MKLYTQAINTGVKVVEELYPKAMKNGGLATSEIKLAIQRQLPKIDVQHVNQRPKIAVIEKSLGCVDTTLIQQKNGNYNIKQTIYVDDLKDIADNSQIMFFPIIGHETTHVATEKLTNVYQKLLNKHNDIFDKDTFVIINQLWLNVEESLKGNLLNPIFNKFKKFEVKSCTSKELFKLMGIKDFIELNSKTRQTFIDEITPATFKPEGIKATWELMHEKAFGEVIAYETTEQIASGLTGVPKSIYSYYSKFYENLARAFQS